VVRFDGTLAQLRARARTPRCGCPPATTVAAAALAVGLDARPHPTAAWSPRRPGRRRPVRCWRWPRHDIAVWALVPRRTPLEELFVQLTATAGDTGAAAA